MTKPRFFIIDAFAHIFRAYYAIKHMDNNVVYGFTATLRKILQSENPEYIAVAFDSPGPTFRKQIFPEYKANRQAAPEDLVAQIPKVRDVIQAYNIPIIEKDGFEADDIIGTLAKKAAAKGLQAVIVSGDKDLLQLVQGQDIVMYDPKKEVLYLGEEGVPEFFGCLPNQIIDLLTIWGDASDNIPGVKGVGEKGAKKLLEEYGSLDGIYANLDQIKRKSYREGFEAFRQQRDLTRKLVTIVTDLEFEFDHDTFKRQQPETATLRQLFTQLNFKSMLEEEAELPLSTCTRTYEAVTNPERLKHWVAEAQAKGFIVFDLETSSLDPHVAKIAGIALSLSPAESCYVPLRHAGQTQDWADQAESILRPMFANPEIRKCAHNAKFDMTMLHAHGFPLAGPFDDTMLMSSLLNPNDNRHGLDFLAESLLNYQTIHFEDVCGVGKDQITFDHVPIDQAADYAAEDADICFRLYQKLWPKLQRENLIPVYESIERPLIPVLAHMEFTGIRVNTQYLEAMSQIMAVRIGELEQEIYALAGEEFNIGSPKQLGVILFEKLELPVQKKTSKTKAYSTSQDVLEKLAAMGFPLPVKLLEYRMLTKLKSTYVDKLPSQINPVTNRVHSSFNQFIAATGRLSSNDPNLQNIPIKTKLGREIRAAFVPEDGWSLIAADYSQVELRLMAHFCGDKTLSDAFRSGEDIHRRTASEVMGIPADQVDDNQRRMAKSINFGLIYGMGDFRLSQELNITRKEAKTYIDTYFSKMPDVLMFRDRTIEEARHSGEIRTHFGRKRPIPELSSRNKNLQNQGERLAVNSIIQGTAAEMIKLAMIRLQQRIKEEKLKARILLQVHDELVLECPDAEVEATQALLKEVMEKVVDFSVPFPVEIHVGKNWKEAK